MKILALARKEFLHQRHPQPLRGVRLRFALQSELD